MATKGQLISVENQHISYSNVSTGWVTTPKGEKSFIFLRGSQPEVRAYFYWINKNRARVDVVGWGGTNDNTAGYYRLDVTGSHALTGGYSYQTGSIWWCGDGNATSPTPTVDTIDAKAEFWYTCPYDFEGDDSWYRVRVANMNGWNPNAYKYLLGRSDGRIYGRGWWTDKWWGIARILPNYTGPQGAPCTEVGLGSLHGTMPVFTTVDLAVAAAKSWKGTYITAANAELAYPGPFV